MYQLCMAEIRKCFGNVTASTLMQHYTILVQYKIEIRKMLSTQHIRFPLMTGPLVGACSLDTHTLLSRQIGLQQKTSQQSTMQSLTESVSNNINTFTASLIGTALSSNLKICKDSDLC